MNPAAMFRALAQSRRSSRRFQANKTIPAATIRDMLESALRSPSSFNLQPSQILLVQDPFIKETLAEEAMLGPGNQFRTRDASALAFFLTDLEPTKRIDRIFQLERTVRNANYLSSLPLVPSFLIGEGHAATLLKTISTQFLADVQAMPVVEPVQAWGYKNTALLAQTFVYAAASHDLATCIMEGYDGRKVQEILRIPDRYAVPLLVAVGYEYEDPQNFESTPRLPLEEVVFQDTFGQPWLGVDEPKQQPPPQPKEQQQQESDPETIDSVQDAETTKGM